MLYPTDDKLYLKGNHGQVCMTTFEILGTLSYLTVDTLYSTY